MKISEVTADTVSKYLIIDSSDSMIAPILAAAKAYVLNYTGIAEADADNYEDITIALLVLCSDMYDNRQMAVDNSNVNKVVQSVLDMHCFNLL
jgi:hypothetical protein